MREAFSRSALESANALYLVMECLLSFFQVVSPDIGECVQDGCHAKEEVENKEEASGLLCGSEITVSYGGK